ncbi:hypothetical protein WJX77_008557 [Trebouxia sp. C0004]
MLILGRIAFVATAALLICGNAASAGRALLQDAPTDEIVCDVAVVGGGPGGVYSAYRLLEANASSNVCLFETNNRVGGRVYSLRNLGPKKDLTLDMGAYRYMPIAQPLITDLIERLLELPNRLYQPGIADYRVVLDSEGNNAGFATYVEKLFGMAEDMGLKASFSTHIDTVDQHMGGFLLTTASNTSIRANKVVLNLATRPLHRLLQNSNLPGASRWNSQLEAPYINRATKLYLYYPQAWWIQQGLTNGSIQYVDTEWPPVNVPVIGRYHDAQAKCPLTTGNGYIDYHYNGTAPVDTDSCYGYFQATYTSDAGMTNISHLPLDYLVDYAGNLDTTTPYSVWDNSTVKGAKLLKDAHARLMAYHANASIELPPGTQDRLPTEAIVAFWDSAITWIGGGWSSMKDPEDSGLAESVDSAVKPYANLELYVANEAYSTQQGWSEGSLTMTENYLQRHFNVGIPKWMRPSTWPQINFVVDTFNDYEEAPQGITIQPVTAQNMTALTTPADTNGTATTSG